MTIGQGGEQADVKMRPPGHRGIWRLSEAGLFLVAAVILLAGGQIFGALLCLVFVSFYVHCGLANVTAGVDLTPDFAVIPSLRRRRVPWVDVKAVETGAL